MGTPSPSSTSASLLCRLRQSPPEPAAWGEFARRYGYVSGQPTFT